MNITFKHTQYEPTSELLEETTKKIEALARFLGGASDATSASVHLERAVGSKKQGDVWRAEVTIDHEGSRFQAESTKAKLDHAVTTAIRDLKEKLRRVHKKEEDFFRKGGAAVKSFLRGFRD